MATIFQPVILFLCTGNYYRSRFAELLFNRLAVERDIDWRAASRGLAIELGYLNVGPISSHTVDRLTALNIAFDEAHRMPLACTQTDFTSATRVIALNELEHRALMSARFPDWLERIEYWNVHDLDMATAEEALAKIEKLVRALVNSLAKVPNEKPGLES